MNTQKEQNEILKAIKKLKKAVRVIKRGMNEKNAAGCRMVIEGTEELIEDQIEKFEQLRIMERDA